MYKYLLPIFLIGMIVAGLLATSAISQSTAVKPAQYHNLLNDSYQLVNCKTSFAATGVNDIISAVPSLSYLQNNLTALEKANSQLQIYVNESNYTAFRNYVKSTYNPTLKSLVTSAVMGLKESNLSSNTISTLKTDYASSKSSYQQCTFLVLSQIGSHRINQYNKIISHYQARANKLSAQGFNVTELNETLNQSKSEVVNPLQSAFSNSTNSSQIRKVLGSYCLFSGCKNGLNYHLAAKFSTEELGLVISKLDNISNVNATLLNNATTTLANAKAELAIVGNSKYTGNEANVIWTNITYSKIAIKKIVIERKNDT